MLALHLICRAAKHVHTLGGGLFESGYWDLPVAEGRRLVGGMLYLHETKGARSFFGGTVEAVRIAEASSAFPGRLVFTLRATREGRGAAWQGASHGMAWSGGIVEE